jgi:pilus assembly protein CpaD
MTIMTGHTARAIAIVGLAALLAGCKAHQSVTSTMPADYRQRHPIAVKEGTRSVELFIGDRRGSLDPTQQAEVASFAHTWRREATGGIIIDVPAGTPNERAAADALREVRSILAVSGVPGEAVALKPYRPDTPVKLATLRLNYPKMIAEAGPCGLWPTDLGPSLGAGTHENKEYWNFGCSSQRNMAAMAANPADLVQPREETAISAARRSTVLGKWQKGEATATQDPNAGKGKISDVGQ